MAEGESEMTAEAFNTRHPVGTWVRFRCTYGEDIRTRRPAYTVQGNAWVALERNGQYLGAHRLDKLEIVPVPGQMM
jgi:hypothetical protein